MENLQMCMYVCNCVCVHACACMFSDICVSEGGVCKHVASILSCEMLKLFHPQSALTNAPQQPLIHTQSIPRVHKCSHPAAEEQVALQSPALWAPTKYLVSSEEIEKAPLTFLSLLFSLSLSWKHTNRHAHTGQWVQALKNKSEWKVGKLLVS